MTRPIVDVQMNLGVQAFGMSITTGALAVNAVNYWVNRLAQYIGGPVDNRAVGGTGLQDMVKQAYSYIPYSTRTKLVVVDGPLNDVRRYSVGALPMIEAATDAIIVTAFAGYMRGAGQVAPQVTRTGSWTSLGTSYGGRSCYSGFGGLTPVYSTDPLASITFTFSGPVVALCGFLSDSTDWADMDVEIDGAYYCTTDWQNKALAGSGKQCAALMISGLSTGVHTLKVTPKPGSSGPIVVDCIQCPTKPAAPVILGTIPNIVNWAYSGAIGTWPDAQAANVILEAVMMKWQSWGFPVGFAEILTQPYDYSSDGVHPTDRGQLNWAIAYLAGLRITPLPY